MRQRLDLALVAALYCVALFARLVPLFVSTLPYSPDGFPLTKIADQIAASGRWRIDPTDVNREDLKVPGISFVLSAVAQLTALDLLLHVQVVFPFLSATIVASAYLIGIKGTGRRAAGLAAGFFVAIYGSLLFLTSAVLKETLGLVLLPATILMVHERTDPRKRGIAVVLLLLLMFVDYLTLFMAMGIATSLVLLSHAEDLSRRSLSAGRIGLDLAMIGGPLGLAWAYYNAVNLFYFTQVISVGAVVALLAAGVVLLLALLLWRRKPVGASSIHGFLLPLVILFIGASIFGAILLAPRSNTFVDVPDVRPELLAIAPAVGFLAVLAGFGYRMMRRIVVDLSTLAVSMLATPLVLILFGLAINQSHLSFRIVYRSIDFVDFGFAILAGLGLAMAVARFRFRRPVGVAFVAAFLVALLATTPIAYDTTSVFGVETSLTPQEFQAMQLITSLGAKTLLSDMRLSTVAEWWFGLRTNFLLPIWLEDRTPIVGFDYALVLERWTNVGATMFPGPTVIVSRAILEGFLSANRVMYVFGTSGDRTYIVRLLSAPN